jgi:membrane-bound lytic murein transglycosylase D
MPHCVFAHSARTALQAALCVLCLLAWPLAARAEVHAVVEDSDRPEAQEALPEASSAAGPKEEPAAPQDFEEIEELRALEREAFTPAALTRAVYPELLAPYTGSLAALRAETGLLPSLYALPPEQARGAALVDLPEVRARADALRVLDQDQLYARAPVRAYLDFFDGRGKRLIARWAQRMALYEPMIRATLREEGLPEDLIFVAMIESGFRPHARSPARAVGMWQFMAGTGRDMGLVIDRHVDERRDPVKSTRAAARYLKKMYARYNSWPLALAAYNAGPGTVDKEIVRLNSNDYWVLSEQEGIYEEARRYVPKILAAALILKHRDVFGLDRLVAPAPLDFDEVEVRRGLRLSVVASAIREDVDALMTLNPELLHAAVPPGEGTYTLRVPRGKAALFVERVDKITRQEGEEHVVYTVRFGETVEQIAAHHRIAPHVLRAVNGLGRKARVRLGQVLVLPAQALGKWEPPAVELPEALVPKAMFDYPERERHFYAVQRGDTLAALAQGFGVASADLALWNSLDPAAHLKPGMILQLFLPARPTEEPAPTLALLRADLVQIVHERPREQRASSRDRRAGSRVKKKERRGRMHTVRKGDTIASIAKRHGLTQEQLERLNPGIKKQKFLQLGQQLKIQ